MARKLFVAKVLAKLVSISVVSLLRCLRPMISPDKEGNGLVGENDIESSYKTKDGKKADDKDKRARLSQACPIIM